MRYILHISQRYFYPIEIMTQGFIDIDPHPGFFKLQVHHNTFMMALITMVALHALGSFIHTAFQIRLTLLNEWTVTEVYYCYHWQSKLRDIWVLMQREKDNTWRTIDKRIPLCEKKSKQIFHFNVFQGGRSCAKARRTFHTLFCFLGQIQSLLGKKCMNSGYILHTILMTDFDLQICNYPQKRRICRQNICVHFCARRKAANFCHPDLYLALNKLKTYQ